MNAQPAAGRSGVAPRFRVVADAECRDSIGRCADALKIIAALMSLASGFGCDGVGEVESDQSSLPTLLAHASEVLAIAARQAAASQDGAIPSRSVGARTDPPRLSPRERQLLALVGQGLTDRDIAAALAISLTTVHSHLDRIRDKTGRRNRAHLTRLALDLGLLVDSDALGRSG